MICFTFVLKIMCKTFSWLRDCNIDYSIRVSQNFHVEVCVIFACKIYFTTIYNKLWLHFVNKGCAAIDCLHA